MYFSDLIGVLRRRWRIFAVGMLLMGGASAGIMVYVPANYQASGNVLFLLPPKTGTVVINPFLNLQSGLSAAASIVGSVMMTTETQASVAQAGFTSTYAVSQAPGGGVPLLSVSAVDTDPQMAVKTVNEVIRRIDAQLTLMQELAGAPSNQLISISTFSVTQQAEVVHGAKLRALAVALAVVGVGTALVAFTVDASRMRKAAQGAERTEADLEVEKAAAAGHAASRTRGRIRRRRRDMPKRAHRSLVKATSYSALPPHPSAPRSPVTAGDVLTATPTPMREDSDSDLELAGWQQATRSE